MPTPAAGWTVSDQVRHLVVSERAAAIALDGHGDDLFSGTVKIDSAVGDAPGALLADWRRARTATADEKPALWRQMTAIWPDYDNYQRKTEREIPVVVLERQPG